MFVRNKARAALLLGAIVGMAGFASPTAAATVPNGGAQPALRAVSGTGSGHVLIAPTAEDHGTFAAKITIDVQGALPKATYVVTRAVDRNPDEDCTLDSGWLATGTLQTSASGAGAGHFEVHRGAPFVSGTRFDVEFRLIANDSELRSDCATVTVK
jgi:hypothetical protein